MFKTSLPLVLLILLIKPATAQKPLVLPAHILNGDTVGIVKLPAVIIEEELRGKYKRSQRYNKKLIRNVKKVMPYAKIAASRLKVIDQEMARLKTEKERKKYYNAREKELREQFEQDMVNMNFSQGILLLKLIDRETSKTTYQILKDYRNSVTAVFWQSFARLFGYNLKKGYDPVKDHDIEMAVKMLGYD